MRWYEILQLPILGDDGRCAAMETALDLLGALSVIFARGNFPARVAGIITRTDWIDQIAGRQE